MSDITNTNNTNTELEVTMFDQGRVTIKKPIRDKLGLKKGSRFVIIIKKILDFESLPAKPRKEKDYDE